MFPARTSLMRSPTGFRRDSRSTHRTGRGAQKGSATGPEFGAAVPTPSFGDSYLLSGSEAWAPTPAQTPPAWGLGNPERAVWEQHRHPCVRACLCVSPGTQNSNSPVSAGAQGATEAGRLLSPWLPLEPGRRPRQQLSPAVLGVPAAAASPNSPPQEQVPAPFGVGAPPRAHPAHPLRADCGGCGGFCPSPATPRGSPSALVPT